MTEIYCTVSIATLSAQKVLDSITGPVKSDLVSPAARHCCDVSSELCCSDAKPRRWPSGMERLSLEL